MDKSDVRSFINVYFNKKQHGLLTTLLYFHVWHDNREQILCNSTVFTEYYIAFKQVPEQLYSLCVVTLTVRRLFPPLPQMFLLFFLVIFALFLCLVLIAILQKGVGFVFLLDGQGLSLCCPSRAFNCHFTGKLCRRKKKKIRRKKKK